MENTPLKMAADLEDPCDGQQAEEVREDTSHRHGDWGGADPWTAWWTNTGWVGVGAITVPWTSWLCARREEFLLWNDLCCVQYSMCIVQLLRFFFLCDFCNLKTNYDSLLQPSPSPRRMSNVCKSLLINCTCVSTVYLFPRAHKCKYLNFIQISSTYCKFSCEQIFLRLIYSQCNFSRSAAIPHLVRTLRWRNSWRGLQLPINGGHDHVGLMANARGGEAHSWKVTDSNEEEIVNGISIWTVNLIGLWVFPTRLLTSEDECKWFWHQMIYFPGTINTVSTWL
jgi:hypothetical protein